MKYLVLLEENSAVNVAEGCIYETENEIIYVQKYKKKGKCPLF